MRTLQSLVEIGVDKNTTVVFPAPLMSMIEELGAFLSRETAANAAPAVASTTPIPAPEPGEAPGLHSVWAPRIHALCPAGRSERKQEAGSQPGLGFSP